MPTRFTSLTMKLTSDGNYPFCEECWKNHVKSNPQMSDVLSRELTESEINELTCTGCGAYPLNADLTANKRTKKKKAKEEDPLGLMVPVEVGKRNFRLVVLAEDNKPVSKDEALEVLSKKIKMIGKDYGIFFSNR